MQPLPSACGAQSSLRNQAAKQEGAGGGSSGRVNQSSASALKSEMPFSHETGRREAKTDIGVRSTGESRDGGPGRQAVLKPRGRNTPLPRGQAWGEQGPEGEGHLFCRKRPGRRAMKQRRERARRQAETGLECTMQDPGHGPLGTLGSQVSPLCAHMAA